MANDDLPPPSESLPLSAWMVLNPLGLVIVVVVVSIVADPLLNLMLVPPIIMAQIIWLARLELEAGNSSEPNEAVEILLQKKRNGTILKGSRDYSCTPLPTPSMIQAFTPVPNDDTQGALDRLLTCKRRRQLRTRLRIDCRESPC